MIISHRYRCIFVKTKKTAGTSIEVFLSQHCGEDDIVTPIYPHVEPHRARNYKGRWNPIPECVLERRGQVVWTDWYRQKRFYNHLPARVIRRRVSSRLWNSYFKFCVERNPWDKTLSHYCMRRDRARGALTWEQYLAQADWPINAPFYTDRQGRLLVDRVLRYEHLTEELADVFRLLGVPFARDLGVHAKSEHRRDRTPYQQVYTEPQAALIGQVFSHEIRMHGYQF
jgi:hypothetical protein